MLLGLFNPSFRVHTNEAGPYLVADADVLAAHELPAGWGWLRPVGNSLELVTKPIWHDVDEDQRLEFLHRIAQVGTRAVNDAAGLTRETLSGSLRRRSCAEAQLSSASNETV